MPILQEKCFGQKKQVKMFGQTKNTERGSSKERKGFKTLEVEEDKENTPVKGYRKFGDKKQNSQIKSQNRKPIEYPTVNEKFKIDPMQTYSKMPHNLGVQSVKPFAVIFKNSNFLPNLKIKISSNSSSRKIESPDGEPLKDLMDFSFVVNPKKNPADRFTPKTLDETWASFRSDFDKSINQSLGWLNQSEMINDSSGFDCNCSSPLVLDFHECLNWGRVKICVACNKSHESQLEQTQLEVTQIPNSLDKTWICNEKGQKLYGGFEDWRREKKLPIKNAPEKIGESIEEPSDDETDESLGERTVIPNSLDTTWNGTWSTTD